MEQPEDRMAGRKSRKIARKLKRAAKRTLQEANSIHENVDAWFSLIGSGKSAFVTPHDYDRRVHLDLSKLSPHREGAQPVNRASTARAPSMDKQPLRMPMSARASTMSVRSTLQASSKGRQTRSSAASTSTHSGQIPASKVPSQVKQGAKLEEAEIGDSAPVKFWAESVKHVNVTSVCKHRGPIFLASNMIHPSFFDAFIDLENDPRPKSAAPSSIAASGFRSEDERVPTAGTWKAGHEVLGQRWGGLGTRIPVNPKGPQAWAAPSVVPRQRLQSAAPSERLASAASSESGVGVMQYDRVRHITVPHVHRAQGRGVINQTMHSPVALSVEQLLATKPKGYGISACTKVMRGGPGTALLVSHKAPPIASLRRTGEFEMENRLCRSYPRQALHGLRLNFQGARVVT